MVSSKPFTRVFSSFTSKMAATDSVESVDWPAAILDSRCRWTLGESLTHSQSGDGRNLNSDIEGFLQNAATWRELFQFTTATAMRALKGPTLAPDYCGLEINRKEN